MTIRRLMLAAAVAAGASFSAIAQTPPAPAATQPPAATPPATNTPSAPNPAIQKALEALSKNDLALAIKILEDAKKLDPKLKGPLVILAEQMYRNNQPQAARQLVERAGVEQPNHPDPFILSGVFALNEGRMMDAMLCFEKANLLAEGTGHTPEERKRFYESVRGGLAQVYSQRSDWDRALTQLQLLLADNPKNAGLRVEAARIILNGNKPELAFEELKTAHKDDPDNPQISLPELNMGRFWDGKMIFIPRTEEAKFKAEETKNKSEAETWFKKALDTYPKDHRAPREYARWLLNQFRIEDADKQLQAANGLNPNDNEISALMGLSCRYKKDFAGAQEIFRKLDNADPGNVIYQWNRALSMAESKEKEDQSRAVNLAAQLAQNQQYARNPEAHAVLTWCLFKAGRLDEADRAGGECLKVGNGMAGPDTRYYLANILVARDKKKEARDMLKPALEAKAFVYRKEAEALYNKLLAEFPEEKKPDEKKP